MATLQTPPKQRTQSLKAKKSANPATQITPAVGVGGQERWDELLATPESDALLMLLIEDAKRNEAAGKYDEEDW